MSRARERRAITKMLDSCKVRDLARTVRKERTEKAKEVMTFPPYAYNQPELMDGILIYYLVHEFLESLELYNTLAVFSREAAAFDSKNHIEYHPIMGLEWFLKSFFMSDKYQGLLPILLRFYKSAGKRVRDRRRRNGDLAMAVERAELEEMQKELTGQLNGAAELRGCNFFKSKRGEEEIRAIKYSPGGCQKPACARKEKVPVTCSRNSRSALENDSERAQEEVIQAKQSNSTNNRNFRTSTPKTVNQNEGSSSSSSIEQDIEPTPQNRSCGRQPIDLSKRLESPRSCPRKETCPVMNKVTRQEGFMIEEDNVPIDLSKQPPVNLVKLCERPNASTCGTGTCPRKSMPGTTAHEAPRQPIDYEPINQHGPEKYPISLQPEPALDRSSFLLNQRRRQSRPRGNSLSLRKEIEKRGNALTKENVTFHEFLEDQELREDFKEQYLKGWKPPVPAIVFEDGDEGNEEGEPSSKGGGISPACNLVAEDPDPPEDLVEFGPMTFYQHRNKQYMDAEREHQTNMDKINKFFASQRPKLRPRKPFRTGH